MVAAPNNQAPMVSLSREKVSLLFLKTILTPSFSGPVRKPVGKASLSELLTRH